MNFESVVIPIPDQYKLFVHLYLVIKLYFPLRKFNNRLVVSFKVARKKIYVVRVCVCMS